MLISSTTDASEPVKATTEETKDWLVKRAVLGVVEAMSTSEIVALLGKMDTATASSLLLAITDRAAGRTGTIVLDYIYGNIKSVATANVDSKIKDNAISIDDLGTIIVVG